MSKKNSKDDVYWKVLNCALELEFKKGHLKWTFSDISRKSKITRSLIYYHFGRSKMDILQAAIDIIGKEFTGIDDPKRQALWYSEKYEESLLEARHIYEKMPHLCAFYMNHRKQPNQVGQALDSIEKGFKKRLKTLAPTATPSQINTLFAVYFGIAYAPEVGAEEIKIFAQFIKSILGKVNPRVPTLS